MRVGPSLRICRYTEQTARCCGFLRIAVVSDSGKGGTIRHVRLMELNESEPFDDASKS